MRSTRRAIFERAAATGGLITRAELTGLGITPSGRRALLADGSLERLSRNVFRVGGAPLGNRGRLLAAVLDTGGVASHRSAAWLHGLPAFGPRSEVEVVRLDRRASYVSALARVHTTTALPRHDVTEVDGIPVLSVARTLFSLAALVPAELGSARLRSAVDDAVRLRLASDPWLWWRLEQLRCRGRNGVKAFEEVLVARADSPTESWLEREFLALVDGAGLPVPVCQARIAPRGSFVARVDFLYPGARVVVEVSGAIAHASAEQRADDAARRNRLLLEGYLVLEFTYEQVVTQPSAVIAHVRQALGGTRAA